MNHDLDSHDRKTVLYVEDHPVNVLLMSALLDRCTDFELVVATDGRQAMNIAAKLQPSLLLLDLHLPDCHGSELLPLLRFVPGYEYVPAVAVTADHEFDIGGTGFLELWAKPLNLSWVLRRLASLTAAPGAAGQSGMHPSLHANPRLPALHMAAG